MQMAVLPPQSVDCEAIGSGWLGQPINTLTSLAFMAAGALLAIRALRRTGPGRGTDLAFAALVAFVGGGSVAFHGPHPPWAEWAHDTSIVLVLAFLTVRATARPVAPVMHSMAGAGIATLLWLVPASGDPLAVVLVVGAAALVLRRQHRIWTPTALESTVGLLAAGGIIGALSRTGWPLCRPESLWQGHGVWHVLAAAALLVLGWQGPTGYAAPPRPGRSSPTGR